MAPTVKSLSQTQATQKKPKSSTSRPKTVKLDGNGPSSSVPLKMKRLDPLTAFSRHLTPSSTPPTSGNPHTLILASQTYKGKGKAKAKEKATIALPLSSVDDVDDALWVDKYEPTTEAQLAVHVRKVEDVRRWLSEAFDGGPSGKLRKYRRILALTGPAGVGKTSTIRVLAREMGFEILEWRNAIGEVPSTSFGERDSSHRAGGSREENPEFNTDYEGLFTKFEAFLTRASTCQNIFADSPSSSNSQNSSGSRRQRIILLEDLPNILHQKTQAQFHGALNALISSPPSNPPIPVVIIISDAGMRGETSDERISDGRGWGRETNQVVDVRTVLSKDLLGGPYVTEIGFNPIAPTLLRKALQAMLNTQFASTSSSATISPSKEVLDVIVESANGDIRSAIMALQFACIVEVPGRKKKGASKTMVMEAVTRREQSLALFHLLGKVLYNKRKGDPPSSSATAKDLQKERDIDATLKDPVKLPPHLQYHERRASRVDLDMLYADSPIDSSLFSLYIHQNYTQFCNEIDETAGVADWLSWVDSSGGEAWYQTNPHQFHLLSLGTLHSLPSPVPRRSQKYFKPEFFAYLQKEKEAWDGVRTTQNWIMENEFGVVDSGWRAGGWSKNEVILELGGILKAKDATLPQPAKPPTLHKMFSRMEFTRGGNFAHAKQLNEGDVEADQRPDNDAELDILSPPMLREQKGGWLESDDIEDFE